MVGERPGEPSSDGALRKPAGHRRERYLTGTGRATHRGHRVHGELTGRCRESHRIGLAGVLVLEPSVIVLDEPLAGLDPERSRLVADRVRGIHEDGISVVLSTHDLDFAAEVADRVCVMADGNVIGSGTPQEVFYDDSLLTSANLHPPSPVRVARDVGLDASARPVTESELVTLLTDGTADSEPIQSIDGSGDD